MLATVVDCAEPVGASVVVLVVVVINVPCNTWKGNMVFKIFEIH